MQRKLESREDIALLLLDIIRPLKEHYSEGHAWLHVGDTGAHYGVKAARMEGFARVLWGLGPLLRYEYQGLSKEIQEEIEEWRLLYLDGIRHGTDREHEEYWGELVDYDQKMVELAALVTALLLSPEKLWEPLSEREKQNVFEFLSQINKRRIHNNNWRFFRILTNMALRLLGMPWSEACMEEDIAIVESCARQGGWYVDGHDGQVDYYVPFAMHFYSLIYAGFMKEEDRERSELWKGRSEQFCEDFIYWFNRDGEEIPFGRSLTYRFAHSAFFSALLFAGAEGVGYGRIKKLLLGNMRSWMERPVFDSAGILSIGYHYPNLFMSERYNAPGSPYWALKAFWILALPEDHPFWLAGEEAPVYERKKYLPVPHMLIEHLEDGHVIAYVTGQHAPDFGHSTAKYEKFAYSSRYGFCVPRGVTLEAGAFDNVLAVSEAGENHYRMRDGAEEFEVTEDAVYTKYRIGSAVMVKSIIIPFGNWHVRIHTIENERAVSVADGGFAIRVEDCFEVKPGQESGKYTGEMVTQTEDSVLAKFPWGSSGILSCGRAGEAKFVFSFPNTNLFYNLTGIPTLIDELEPGCHRLIHAVYCGSDGWGEKRLSAKLLNNKVTITLDGEERSIACPSGWL